VFYQAYGAAPKIPSFKKDCIPPPPFSLSNEPGTVAVGVDLKHVEKGETAACFVPGEWSIKRAEPHKRFHLQKNTLSPIPFFLCLMNQTPLQLAWI
jgi:hypothetical protein